jgi:hypothetical protein
LENTRGHLDRRAELDAYEDDIIDIYNFFGSKFYDYRKLFSSKAAVLLREKSVSKRDRDIISLISSGVQVTTCKICNSVEHTTPFCPLHLQQTENKARNSFTDRYGRHRFYYDDKEICNNFNGSKGSPRPTVLLHMSFLNAKRQAIHKTNVENPFHHSL